MARDYREQFSNAYQMLYKGDKNMLYYLFISPADQCLYVNSKRYDFSPSVLEAGHKLVQSFIDIQHLIRKNYIRATYENSQNSNVVAIIQSEMTRALEYFDVCWTDYERVGRFDAALHHRADADRS